MIAVWFSCGAASAVAAKLTVDIYGSSDIVRVINNPVVEEDEDNRRFLRDVEQWIGVPIEICTASKYPIPSAQLVWSDRSYMAGNAGAPCTVELKKRARQEWQNKHRPDWHVLGFTADEQVRHNRFVLSELDNVIPVLIEQKISKDDCYRILRDAGIELPRTYAMGYPNGNCIGCVKASSPTYWSHVREHHPVVFEQRATQSRQLGARLVRHKGSGFT